MIFNWTDTITKIFAMKPFSQDYTFPLPWSLSQSIPIFVRSFHPLSMPSFRYKHPVDRKMSRSGHLILFIMQRNESLSHSTVCTFVLFMLSHSIDTFFCPLQMNRLVEIEGCLSLTHRKRNIIRSVEWKKLNFSFLSSASLSFAESLSHSFSKWK